MSELDPEALKRLRVRLLRVEGPPDLLEGASIPVFHWTFDLIDAHIDALEGYERLRSEVETVRRDIAVHGGGLEDEDVILPAAVFSRWSSWLRAALEGK